MREQKNPSINCKLLGLFCVPLIADYEANLHEKFQVTCAYYANIDYHSWSGPLICS